MTSSVWVNGNAPGTELHVVVDEMPVGGSGLTDAELRATPVDVAVVSMTGGGLTDAELRASPVPVSGTVTANLSEPISVDDNGGSITVDGTFWQATQPISAASLPLPTGAATAALQLPNSHDVTIDNAAGASAVNIQDGGNSITVDGTVAVSSLPALVAGTANIGDVDVLTLPALSAGTNRIGSVRVVDSADADQTTTKGTQTSRFLGVQNVTDSGRVNLQYYATAVASGTTGTETAITLNRRPDTGAGSSAASHVITSGKRFRMTSITFASRGHNTATAQVTTFSIRVNTAGAVTTASTPIILQARCATPATALAWDRFTISSGESPELTGDGTMQFGVTANAVFVTNAPTWDVLITGYEY